jgi:predicted phage tail protein
VNLTATVVGNTVTLAWQPPATGGAPFSYLVEAALSPGGAPIASLPVVATSLTVSSVPNGVYYVRVRALSAAGISGPSNETIVVVPSTGSCAAAPSAPTNFTATATGNSVTLTWSAPAGGCPATGYVVQAGSAPGLTDIAVVNVGGVTSVSAIALSGTYYLRVIALNASGISSPTGEVMLKVGP